MQIRKVFLFLVFLVFLGLPFQASAKISFEKMIGRDSVVMVIREIQQVDSIPFQQAYEKVIEDFNKLLRELSDYEQIGQQFLFGNISGATNTGASHSQMKPLTTVQTPKQREFMEIILEQMKPHRNYEKDAKDIEKKLAKGKLSKKAKPYINEVCKNIEKRKVKIQEEISALEHIKDKEGVVKCMKSIFPDKKIKENMISIKDTIINLSWRPAIYLNSSSKHVVSHDEKEIVKGWEWAMSENNKEMSEQFPTPVSYYFSNSYPEFRILKPRFGDNENWIIYNKKGELMAVANFRLDEMPSDSKFEKIMLAHAYKNNDLNIQSYSDHTKHYVKVQSGLEALTAKEKKAQERGASALANAYLSSMKANMAYGKNSRKAKAVERKSAAQAFGAMFSNSNFYDELGSRWIDEVKGKYKSSTRHPYKTMRIDNTTFKSVYVNKEGKGLFEIITKFEPDGPYKSKKQYTINSLADKQYFTPEEVKEHNKLNANK